MGQSAKRDKKKLDISLVHGIVVPIITPLKPDETVDESVKQVAETIEHMHDHDHPVKSHSPGHGDGQTIKKTHIIAAIVMLFIFGVIVFLAGYSIGKSASDEKPPE